MDIKNELDDAVNLCAWLVGKGWAIKSAVKKAQLKTGYKTAAHIEKGVRAKYPPDYFSYRGLGGAVAASRGVKNKL